MIKAVNYQQLYNTSEQHPQEIYMKLGFIGLGSMGQAMAHNLLQARQLISPQMLRCLPHS